MIKDNMKIFDFANNKKSEGEYNISYFKLSKLFLKCFKNHF